MSGEAVVQLQANSPLSGALGKMVVADSAPVSYRLPLGEQLVDMNALIGARLQISYTGAINCLHCSRATKKSFNQGFCYPCFRKLAACDSCIVSPEKCHFAAGTCREPEWAQRHCFTDHFVYLANSSGVKVGITRGSQLPTRWIDQGAVAALPIFRVANRRLAGLLEQQLRAHVSDRTQWQAMLKGPPAAVDLVAAREQLFGYAEEAIDALMSEAGPTDIVVLDDAEPQQFSFPVSDYPEKVKSFNLDKNAEISGQLQGIKGQYLIFDSGVINVRKFAGYQVVLARLA